LKKILIAEDEAHISELIALHVKDLGKEVDCFFNGRDAYLAALEGKYELIVLDIMMPGMDGLEICRELRANRINTPILMLTSRSEEIDKVLGLETGADDYLTKPFSVRELTARIKALLRRQKLVKEEVSNDLAPLLINDMEIDRNKRKVIVAGDRIELTPKEFDLICLLAENSGKTFSRSRILNLVWGQEYEGYEHTVNSHINRLRSKVEKDANNPQYILTTWGVGYRFTEEQD